MSNKEKAWQTLVKGEGTKVGGGVERRVCEG